MLDCVVVGHNEVSLTCVAEVAEKMRHESAAFQDLQANSVSFRGQRLTYMELLNEGVRLATGKSPEFHVCKLPHLGVHHLASYLKRRNFNVELINFFNEGKDRLIDLLTQEPKAVAITTTLYVDSGPIKEIVNFIRHYNSEAKIIVGGPHISNIFAGHDLETQTFLLQTIGADIFINDSQGELTLSRVLAALRDQGMRGLDRVPNLVYDDGRGLFVRTGKEAENNDVNECVEWRYFDKTYRPTIQTRTARSCAFKCAFCRYPAMAGSLNLASIDAVERHLQSIATENVTNVVFIDDTFNVPLPRFKDLCRMMIRNQFSFGWYSFFRCSNSDQEAFDLMKAAGCRGVFLGLESADMQILKNMNKASTVEKYREGIRQLKERDILTFASVIVGFPGETKNSIENTMSFLEETSPTFYRAEVYYHYTNVPIHERAFEFGIKGAGYSWRHNTMNWQQAAAAVENMYRSIRGPLILPGYMFDFWSIPYLTGQGVSVEQLTNFAKVARDLLLDSFGESPSTTQHEARIASVFAEQ